MIKFKIMVLSTFLGLLSGCSRPMQPSATYDDQPATNDIAFIFLDWSSQNRDVPSRTILLVHDLISRERIKEIETFLGVVDSINRTFVVPQRDFSFFVREISQNEEANRWARYDVYYAYHYTSDFRFIRAVCLDMSVATCTTFGELIDVARLTKDDLKAKENKK